jgi:hypothetical protein
MQSRNDGGALLRHLAVGEAQDPEAEALQLRVASTVGFEGSTVAVVSESIGLDDNSAIPPEEVHLVGPEASIHLWLGKAVTAADGEEATLELAAGEIGLSFQIGIGDQTEIECSADGLLVEGAWDYAVEVPKSSRGTSDGHIGAPGHETGNEGGGPMDSDAGTALPATVRWEGDVNRSGARGKHPPEHRSASMAHRRALTESEGSRHAPAFEGQSGVADGINTAMKAVKSGGSGSLRCRNL